MGLSAGDVVIELEAKLDGYNSRILNGARDFEQGMSRIERSATHAENQVVRSAGAMANASRNLGRQFADVGASLSSGSSLFVVASQQLPQIADALRDVETKAGSTLSRITSFATFLSGPWGAAILAAASVAGVLAEKFISNAHEASEAADKAKQLAAENLKLGDTTASVTAATDLLNKAHLQDRTAELASASRGLASARQAEADATYNAARAQAQLALTQAQGRQSDASRGFKVVGSNGRGQVIEKFSADRPSSRQRSPLDRERALAAEELATAQAALGRLDKAYAQASVRIKREAAALAANPPTVPSRRVASGSRTSRAQSVPHETVDQPAVADEAFRLDIAKRNSSASLNVLQTQADALSPDRIDTRGLEAEVNRITESVSNGLDESFRESEDKVRDLADLYERAFRGGSDNIWRTFKEEGLRTIALLLAQFTVLQSTQGGGGPGNILGNLKSAANITLGGSSGGSLGSLLGSVSSLFQGGGGGFEKIGASVLGTGSLVSGDDAWLKQVLSSSSLPHFADGGSFTVGGNGGIDRNTLSINGRPAAKVSQGEQISVTPRGMVGANARVAPRMTSITVVQPITADFKGTITTPELMRGFKDFVNLRADQARNDAVKISDGRVLPRIAKFQTDGT